MESSEKFLEIEDYYDGGYWSKTQVKYAVVMGAITSAEYETITGEAYVAPTQTQPVPLPSVSTVDNDKMPIVSSGVWEFS